MKQYTITEYLDNLATMVETEQRTIETEQATGTRYYAISGTDARKVYPAADSPVSQTIEYILSNYATVRNNRLSKVRGKYKSRTGEIIYSGKIVNDPGIWLKVLFHELGHKKTIEDIGYKSAVNVSYYVRRRNAREMEFDAETVAAVCCAAIGINANAEAVCYFKAYENTRNAYNIDSSVIDVINEIISELINAGIITAEKAAANLLAILGTEEQQAAAREEAETPKPETATTPETPEDTTGIKRDIARILDLLINRTFTTDYKPTRDFACCVITPEAARSGTRPYRPAAIHRPPRLYDKLTYYNAVITDIETELQQRFNKSPKWIKDALIYLDLLIDYHTVNPEGMTPEDMADAAAIYDRCINNFKRYHRN